MPASPRISVLLPLQEDRHSAAACISAWTEQQSAAPDDFELIALAPGEDPEMERVVRSGLRANDRWIARRGADEYELFNLGAAEAEGEFVLLTEAHCVPEPDFVDAMLAELDRTGATVVRCTSIPDLRGPLGALELSMFEEVQKVEEDPDYWRKILIHGTALRREAFIGAGGTQSRYGDFCPWVLNISLHEAGEKLVYNPRARVHHAYDGELEHCIPFVLSFRGGEVRYRAERPEAETAPYLQWVPEWERRLEFTRTGAARALRAGLAARSRDTWPEVRRYALRLLGGARVAIAQARRGAARAARRLAGAGTPDEQRSAFEEVWILSSRRGVLEGLARFKPQLPDPLQGEGRIDLTASLAGRVIGFHDPEPLDEGGSFRWTEPLALLRVKVPGDARVTTRLELVPSLRRWEAAEPRVLVDQRRVPARVADDAIEFDIDPGQRWIAVATPRLEPHLHGGGDTRALGLPVRSLSFRAASTEPGR